MTETLQALPEGARPLLTPVFSLLGSPVTGLEVAAFAAGIAMVLANLRVNPIGWPLAIFSSAAYALLFADVKLYGEAGLQLFFIAVSCWGWWQWLRGRGADGTPLRVHRLSARQRLGAVLAILALWPLLGALLDHGTDSPVPYFDALPTVASVVGQVLLARKALENWPVWLGVNVVSMALFASKGLWLTVVLYGVFALLSLWGWRAWQQRLRDETARD